MTPINNSDTAWLIVSDYNQDNNLPYETLREDIHNPDTDQWAYESGNGCLIGSIMGDYVGDGNSTVGWNTVKGMGSVITSLVGDHANDVGGNYAPH